MKTHEFTGGETIATAAQAKELLFHVGAKAVQLGDKLYDRYSLLLEGVLLPATIDEHMPDADISTLRISDSANVQCTFNPKTGAQKEAGIVAIVAFSREDEKTNGLTYVTHAQYNIYLRGLDDLTIERLVIHGEHGLPTLQSNLARVATETTNPLAAWTEGMGRAEMPIAAQRKLGLLDVSENEANELIGFVASLVQ